MNLTQNFTLEELTTNGRHPEIENVPPACLMENGKSLAAVLENVRAALDDRPVRVTYGYRSPALNRACGGSQTSAHVDFCAADLVPMGGWTLGGAFQQLIRCPEVMRDVDQIILESGCIHVGIRLARHGNVSRHEIRNESWADGKRCYPLIGIWSECEGVRYV